MDNLEYILFEKLKRNFPNAISYKIRDDPRIDTYYITITPTVFIILYGACHYIDDVDIYKCKIPNKISTYHDLKSFAEEFNYNINDNDEKYTPIYERNFKLRNGDTTSTAVNEIYNKILEIISYSS